MKCQGFLGKEQSSHHTWLTERRGSTRYEIKSGYTEGRGSILGLNILEIMLLSDVQHSEIWVTTMTPGNPKWNGNSSFWIANNLYSARTKKQTQIHPRTSLELRRILRCLSRIPSETGLSNALKVIPEWSSGFPYFLQFKSEFGNKEFMIWSFRYDLNQILYDYILEVTNRFMGLDLVDRVPEKLWMEVCNICWLPWCK